MTILAVLIGLLISHRFPVIAQYRNYDWLMALPLRFNRPDPHWLMPALVIGTAVIAGVIWASLWTTLAGDFGWLIAGAVALAFCLGPHPLDADLRHATSDDDEAARKTALERLMLTDDAAAPRAAAAILHAALARWFGVVLWFSLLGPAGCLVYRLARQAHGRQDLSDTARAGLGRVIHWLNWPVMLFFLLAIGLMTDLDRVWQTVRVRPDRALLPAALLDDVAAALGDSDGDLAAGLTAGRKLIWRVLVLWLVLLSLLLLAGLAS